MDPGSTSLVFFDCNFSQEDDLAKMLAAGIHIGPGISYTTMEQFIVNRIDDDKGCINVINLNKTWEKIVEAARAIAAVSNPADVFVVGERYGLFV